METSDVPVLVVNDTRVDRHHGCETVMRAIIALLKRHRMQAVEFWPAHVDWRDSSRFDAALEKARLVLVNGEGTIHHNRPAGRRLLEIGARAHAAGLPAALINAGWESNGADLVKQLNDFDLVSARDNFSAKQMGAAGAVVRVVPDLSLWFVHDQRTGRAATRSRRSGIGVTDNVDRLKALQLERLRADSGADLISITYGVGGLFAWARFLREGVSLSEDVRRPLRLAALLRMRHRHWREGSENTGRFLDRLAALGLLVSGRFHGCTLALATRTPIVVQSSNTGKIEALLNDAGLDRWRLEARLDTGSLQEALRHGWSKLEHEHIEEYLAHSVQAADELFRDLKRLVT